MAEPRRSTANDASGRAASDLKGARILVVEARFYEDIADALLAGATRALEEVGVNFDRVSVPGALEVAPAIAIAHRCRRALRQVPMKARSRSAV